MSNGIGFANIPPMEINRNFLKIGMKNINLPSGKTIEITPENLNRFHGGSIPSSSRLGIGGPEGQPVLSFGFGNTKEDALKVARAELKHYIPSSNEKNTIEFTKKAKLSNVLVVDGNQLFEYGLSTADLTAKDKMNLNFLNSNILGHLSRKKFDAVLIPSSRYEGGMVLHSFKDNL